MEEAFLFLGALQTLRIKDSWSSKAEAEAALIKLHNAKSWDKRVLDRMKLYDVYNMAECVRDTWGLTSPKHQIAALVGRFNPGGIGCGEKGLNEVTLAQREIVPDSDPDAPTEGPFYRHELKMAWDMLPKTRPWVLYVNGDNSPFFGDPSTRKERLHLTGTGVGGNGGIRLKAVKQVVVKGGEHSMVFDCHVAEVADIVADWLTGESQRWNDGPKRKRDEWLSKSLEERQRVSPEHEAALISEMQKRSRTAKL